MAASAAPQRKDREQKIDEGASRGARLASCVPQATVELREAAHRRLPKRSWDAKYAPCGGVTRMGQNAASRKASRWRAFVKNAQYRVETQELLSVSFVPSLIRDWGYETPTERKDGQ